MDYKKRYQKYKTKYLSLKQGGGKYYYHGSSNEITKDYLEPRPSRVIDNEKAVFATNERYIALVFIPKWSDSDLEFGFYKGIPYLMEAYPDAFDKLKNVKGYIYHLDPKNFKSDPRLGMQNREFISRQNEKILKKEYVKDVFQELHKTKIKFIPFDLKMHAISPYLEAGDVHESHLSEPWFTHIKNGKKVVEGRPNTSKFAGMKKDDIVIFHSRESNDQVVVKIVSKNEYKTFKEMLEKEGLERVLPGISTIDEGVDVYRKFYSEEVEQKNGVAAIVLELI